MFADGNSYDPQDDISTSPAEAEWQPILQGSNQVVLYNPTSHALSVQQRSPPSLTPGDLVRIEKISGLCPYCHRSFVPETSTEEEGEDFDDFEDEHPRSRAPNYFQLLQVSNENSSVPPTPRRSGTPVPREEDDVAFKSSNMAEGYFAAFFQEECRLGMGANGSVYLCRHVLNGNPLGHFAVKKIAVGNSSSYLLDILREVRLLEKMHHPNIITYHHAWLETAQFSSFGPKVPTLHVLMQWAEGGSLDDFINVRLGKTSYTHIHHVHPTSSRTHSQTGPQENMNAAPSGVPYSRGARIRAFRAMQRASPEERERLQRELAGQGLTIGRGVSSDMKAVHLLSAAEVKSLFQDVVEGLGFLHDKSILHLDLKPGNVLLTWDDERLIPRAMLSDFGTSQDMVSSRTRSGNTGTLEYASPESLPSPTGQLSQVDSKSDMWSLGMILHKLLFFCLPYRYASDAPREDSRLDGKELAELLEKEVLEYPGFRRDPSMVTAFDSRHLPRAILVLLEGLLNVKPSVRPSCDRVLAAIREGKLDPMPPWSPTSGIANNLGGLIPVMRKYSHETRETTSSSPQVHVESAPELPPWTDTPARESPTLDIDDGRRAPILTLPAPPSPSSPQNVPWISIRFWNRYYRLDARTSRVILKRTIKSSLLIFKAWSLLRIPATTPIGPIFTTAALSLAVMDTWSDELIESALFLVAHIFLVRLALWLTR